MMVTSETKFFVGILVCTMAILSVAVIVLSRKAPPFTLPKTTLITTTTHTKGNSNAPVWLVEFSDFQCPACKAFAPTVEAIADKYKNDVFVAYRHFPLSKHAFAIPAAIAAESAGKQDKFWEASAYLFKNQENFSDSFWGQMATDLGLDTKVFMSDRTALTGKSIIDEDLVLATAIDLPGTPSFFLNGELLKNINTPQDLQNLVDEKVTQSKKDMLK